jgi:alpha-galactosidase
MAQWNKIRRPGSWPDADMIPFGRLRRRGPFGEESNSRLTRDEQVTLMTFWCLARSPLIFGGDMPLNDASTESLLTNDEVLEANRSGSDPKPLFHKEDKVIWYSRAQDGGIYIGIFNLTWAFLHNRGIAPKSDAEFGISRLGLNGDIPLETA